MNEDSPENYNHDIPEPGGLPEKYTGTISRREFIKESASMAALIAYMMTMGYKYDLPEAGEVHDRELDEHVPRLPRMPERKIRTDTNYPYPNFNNRNRKISQHDWLIV